MSEDINVGQILEVLNNKPDIDFENVPSNSINITRCLTNITDCITEIPQRIKLELNNGTLTLKAGSQVIVPNGFEDDGVTPKFDYVTIESDVTSTGFTGYTFTANCFYVPSLNMIIFDNEYTGTGTNGYQYDTTTNKLTYKGTTSQAGLENATLSFPIGLINMDATISIKAIDQVFNGMGYIGSTVWVDKGVKGLIPNGRNEDGTLRNIEFEVSELTAFKASYASSGQYTLRFFIDKDELYKNKLVCGKNLHWINKSYIFNSKPTSFDNGRSALWIKEDTNEIFVTGDGGNTYLKLNAYACCDVTFGTTQITSFNPKQPFRAVDYNKLDNIYNELDNVYNELDNVYNELDNVIGNNTAPTPKAYITETYVNGTSWYRVYSDGWCEQGGRIKAPTTSTIDITTTLLKSYKNTNYTLVATQNNTTTSSYGIAIKSQATNKFIVSVMLYDNLYANWYTCGYIS